MPTHLVEAIQARISLLREAWHVDDVHTGVQPRLRGYPMASGALDCCPGRSLP
jgi:hypothetical protein